MPGTKNLGYFARGAGALRHVKRVHEKMRRRIWSGQLNGALRRDVPSVWWPCATGVRAGCRVEEKTRILVGRFELLCCAIANGDSSHH